MTNCWLKLGNDINWVKTTKKKVWRLSLHRARLGTVTNYLVFNSVRLTGSGLPFPSQTPYANGDRLAVGAACPEHVLACFVSVDSLGRFFHKASRTCFYPAVLWA